MPISFNTQTAAELSSVPHTTPFTFAVPAGVAVGELMVVHLACFTFTPSAVSFSTPTSGGGTWNRVGTVQTGGASGGLNSYGMIFTRVATVADAGSNFSISFNGTPGATDAFYWVAAFDSYPGAGAIGNFAFSSPPPLAAAPICPTVTTTADNSWGVQALFGAINNVGAIGTTPPTNRTLHNASSGLAVGVSDTNGSAGLTGSSIGGGQFSANNIGWFTSSVIELTISAGPSGPTITASSLPDGSVGVAYSATVSATGGAPPYSWSISAGSLPTGLSINAVSGVISGTPTTSGAFSFTVLVTDANNRTGSANLSINVSLPNLQVTFESTTNHISSYSVLSSMNNTGNAGAQQMRVLVPDAPDFVHYAHTFLWVLPVEPGQGSTFGDPLAILQGLNAQNQYNLTCIQPGFPLDPWYADNPNDASTHQESFMLALRDWARTNLSVSGNEQHIIIGFSKSGNGGQSLFLKHLDKFASVASWDFPGDATAYDQYDGAPVYGTQANFAANYELSETNVQGWIAGSNVTAVKRMWIGGYFLYQTNVSTYESTVLTPLHIIYDGTWSQLAVSHAWHEPWMSAALASLVQPITSRPLSKATGKISVSAVHGKITVS